MQDRKAEPLDEVVERWRCVQQGLADVVDALWLRDGLDFVCYGSFTADDRCRPFAFVSDLF